MAVSVLYIEDDDEQRRELASALRARGFTVDDVSGGREGLEALTSRTFDAVLCDLNMPGVGGLEVLRERNAHQPNLPLVIITARGDIATAVSAIRGGASDFIRKPVEVDEVVVAIQQAIERNELQARLSQASDQVESVARRRDELARANEQLFSLNLASNRFAQIHDEEQFYQEVPQLICDALHFDLGTIGIATNGELRLRAFAAPRLPARLTNFIRKKIDSGDTLAPPVVAEVFHKNETMFVEDIRKHAAPGRGDLDMGLHTLVACPIRVKGKAVGVVAGNCEFGGRRMTEHDIARFEMFAVMAGLALENIRAYQRMEAQVRHRTQELEDNAVALAQANVDLLGAQEQLEEKNQELREAELRMLTIMEASPLPLLVTRVEDGRIVYANKRIVDMVGVTRDKVVGRSAPDFYANPEDRQKVLALLSRDGAVKDFELPMKRADGTVLWMLFSVVKTELSGEDVIVGGLVDIDARKKAEAALEQSMVELRKTHEELKATQSQLVQSEKMAALGMLVSGIAHEINTPIGAISSMHDTSVRSITKLRGEMVSICDQEQAKKFERLFGLVDDANKVINSGIERVTNIVRRLRSFARLDEAEIKDADINEGIEDTLTLVHHEIKHGIEVVKKYGDIRPIPCFPGRLNQVFLNLIVNARQAMDGKGTLTIETFKDGKYVVIKISDTGTGIAPNHLQKIFDPGFTTKGVGVGTGLGLAICYQIMQDHLGSISVESEVGMGTTFTLKVPDDLDKHYDT